MANNKKADQRWITYLGLCRKAGAPCTAADLLAQLARERPSYAALETGPDGEPLLNLGGDRYAFDHAAVFPTHDDLISVTVCLASVDPRPPGKKPIRIPNTGKT